MVCVWIFIGEAPFFPETWLGERRGTGRNNAYLMFSQYIEVLNFMVGTITSSGIDQLSLKNILEPIILMLFEVI